MTKETGKTQTGSAIQTAGESGISHLNPSYPVNCLPDRQGPSSGATSWSIKLSVSQKTSPRSLSSVPVGLGRLLSPCLSFMTIASSNGLATSVDSSVVTGSLRHSLISSAGSLQSRAQASKTPKT